MFFTQAKILVLGGTVLTTSGCAKPDAILLPGIDPQKLDANSYKIRTGESNMISNCTASNGTPLDFCQSGIPVTCEKKARGEYCTQYVDSQNGRMWGPY